MNRRTLLKRVLIGLGVAAVAPSVVAEPETGEERIRMATYTWGPCRTSEGQRELMERAARYRGESAYVHIRSGSELSGVVSGSMGTFSDSANPRLVLGSTGALPAGTVN